jgi:hypothetical protein
MNRQGLMDIAWRDFVVWAFGQKEIISVFNKKTRNQLLCKKSPIDFMIDEATGKTESDIEQFVFWVTKELWGMKYAPQKMKEMALSMRKK